MIIIKKPKQINGIRKACRLAANTIDLLKEHVKPGVSTLELNDIADNYIRSKGGFPACYKYKGYPKSICTSLNEVICHGIPSENDILKDGDIIKIDVSTILYTYYGDTCYTFPVGEVDLEKLRLIEVTRRCLEIGIEQSKPGNYLNNIGYEINEYATSQGFSVVYQFTGHGVGVDFHEDPQVHHIARKNTGPVLRPGMIFTIEPMINEGCPEALVCEQDGWTARTADRKLSAQFEHTLLITEAGNEVLTRANCANVD